MLILNSIVSVDIQNNEHFAIDYGSVLRNYEERKSSVLQSKEFMQSLSNMLKKG